MKTDVTQEITELGGEEPVMQETRCGKCVEVYRSIYKLLSESAQKEMDGQQEEMVKIVQAEPESLTLRLVINRSLMATLKGDELTPELGVERVVLATKVFENNKVALDSKEKTLIKERIAKTYPQALIVGKACIMIDGAMASDK